MRNDALKRRSPSQRDQVMLRFFATLVLAVGAPLQAHAEIVVLQCGFAEIRGEGIFVTKYDDGTPSRVGVAPGVGGRAYISVDPRNGAWVVVEVNLDNIPVTFTTIQPDLQ